jgi:Phytanoyl-CoA dioxygenase (PhyH)
MKYEPLIWRNALQDVGYLVIPDLIEPNMLSLLSETMERITRDPDTLPPHLKREILLEADFVKSNPQWFPDLTPEQCGKAVRQVGNLLVFDPLFVKLLCYPPLLDVLEALFESPEFGLEYIMGRPKPAHLGTGIANGAFHRDVLLGHFPTAIAITALLTLDEMTDENGPTTFIPGSHKTTDEYDEQSNAPTFKVRCPAGSGIFYLSKVLHSAGHNRSPKSRRAILSFWLGPHVPQQPSEHLPYRGLRPRSELTEHRTRMQMAFPDNFALESKG